MTDPMWLERARDLTGLREIPGALHETKILQLWRDAKMPYVRDDETAWCAAFVGAMLERSMITSSRMANARSYSNWGVDVLNDEGTHRFDGIPVGAILVWSRPPNPAQGHVNFAVGRNAAGDLVCLGGNQSDSVSLAPFREANGRELVAARWPTEERDNLRVLRRLPLIETSRPISTNEA